MNEGQLGRRLIEQNAWWQKPNWEQDDPDLRAARAAPFGYRPDPLAGIAPDGLYLLLGPRRVGKSVEIKRAIASAIASGIDRRRVVYFSCDGMVAGDLGRAFRVGRNLSRTVEGPRYWFLDEVTSVTGWTQAIKDVRDSTPAREDCVVLTGSSSRDLQDSIIDFAGRHGDRTDTERLLLPMSFRSFCAAIGIAGVPTPPPVRPRDLFDAKPLLTEMEIYWPTLGDAWQNYLHIGGFPKAVRGFAETGSVPPAFIRDMWDVVRGEAFRSLQMGAPETSTLLARLARALTSTVNLSDLARDLDLRDGERVEARIKALTHAFLGFRIFKDDDGVPQVNAQRKFYFSDPLLARLAHLVDDGHPAPDESVLTEQQVGMAIARAIERERPGAFASGSEIRYWRNDNTGAEVDFVGTRVGLGIEGKYVDAGWRGEIRALLARGVGGICVTRSIPGFGHADAIAVPAGLFAWMIDG